MDDREQSAARARPVVRGECSARAALERRARRLAAGEVRLLAGFDPDLLVFLLFLLLPVFGRVLRGLGERGKDAAQGAGRAAPPARKAPRGAGGGARTEAHGPEAADEARELERSGEEVWRRLLEGLAPEQTPAPAKPPAERRVQPAAPARPVTTPAASPREPAARLRPAPSSVPRGATRLPGLAPSELADPSDLGELAPVGRLGELERRPVPRDRPARRASRSLSVSTSADDLRRAVLWSEILAPPVALRWPSGSPWH